MESNQLAQRLLQAAAVLRLGAVALALVGLTGRVITVSLVLAVVLLGGVAVGQLTQPRMNDFMARHPLVVAVEILVTLAVLMLLGVDSPLVLATFSSALAIGVLMNMATATVAGVILVTGYVVASRLAAPPDEPGFLVTFGIPAIYVMFILVGAVVRKSDEDRRRAHLRLINAENEAAAAEERARLARDLHDSVGKSLHGLALGAAALPMWIDRDPVRARTLAEELVLGTRSAAAEARSLLSRMRAEQSGLSLDAALQALCDRWTDETGIPVVVKAVSVGGLGSGQQQEMLAVVAEALENVARHAQASRVDVSLRMTGDGVLVLQVDDDGVGFSVDSVPSGHFGITGMRERAALVGARVTVSSTPGVGTSVVMSRTLDAVLS